MAFCVNCGVENADGVKFCNGCGKEVAAAAKAAAPAKEKMGNIRTCPNCGEVLESFQSRCKSCGHELNSVEVSKKISEFVDQVNKFDHEIANTREDPFPGSKTAKLVGWVVLNLFTLGIPLLVRVVRNLVAPKASKLLPAEEKKKSYIENFVVPNSREDIVEFVLFASSKVEALMSNKTSDVGTINMWAKMWSSKCSQLQSRAQVVLAGDKQTTEMITRMIDRPQAMMRKARNKNLIMAAAILVPVVTLIIVLTVSDESAERARADARDAAAITLMASLEELYADIRQLVTEGDFSEARIQAIRLVWTDAGWNNRNYWDGRRERLLEEIQMRENL